MRIFIAAQANCTSGGPELLHQFSSSLSENGIENYMIYLNDDGVKDPVPEPYKKYHVKYIDQYIDASDSILVVPEAWPRLAVLADQMEGTMMFWWMSVDNYLASCGYTAEDKNVNIPPWMHFHNVLHFTQSYYAQNFLHTRFGINNSYMLGDYINEDIIKIAASYRKLSYERHNICLYNPLKGYQELKPVIEACRSDIRWIPLINYKPQEMAGLMCLARVYVDFGPHPGKDRIPREAAVCGCCVLTNRKGSAAFQEDVGIPERYKVEDTGNLADVLEKIYDLTDHYNERIQEYSDYRESVLGEKAEFEANVLSAIEVFEKCTIQRKQEEDPDGSAMPAQ